MESIDEQNQVVAEDQPMQEDQNVQQEESKAEVHKDEDLQPQIKQRKNRELSYMQTSNIIDNIGAPQRGPGVSGSNNLLSQKQRQTNALK